MQAVIGGCRSCPFPCPRPGNRRPPQKPAETRISTPGGNATASWFSRQRRRTRPRPSRAEARPHGPGASIWRFSPPNNGQPITLCNNKEVSMRRDEPEGPELRQPENEEPGFLWPPTAGELALCILLFILFFAWSSGMRSSSTPRTPRRTRSTPSSPARAGWRSPLRC